MNVTLKTTFPSKKSSITPQNSLNRKPLVHLEGSKFYQLWTLYCSLVVRTVISACVRRLQCDGSTISTYFKVKLREQLFNSILVDKETPFRNGGWSLWKHDLCSSQWFINTGSFTNFHCLCTITLTTLIGRFYLRC